MNTFHALLIRAGLAYDVTPFTARLAGKHADPPPEVLRVLACSTARARTVRAGATAVSVWTNSDRHADHRPNPWAAMVLADIFNLIADLSPDEIIANPALTFRGDVVIGGPCLMTGAIARSLPRPDPFTGAA